MGWCVFFHRGNLDPKLCTSKGEDMSNIFDHILKTLKTHDGSTYGIYANIKKVFLDGIHVTIYSSTMDPSWVLQ